MHSTNNLDDGYMGSGYRIRRSIKKYGENNHKKIILHFLPDRGCLKEKEKQLVTENLLNDPLCMNLTIGGEGGFTIEQQKLNAEKSKIKQKELRETNLEWVNKKSLSLSKGLKESYKIGKREKKQPLDWTNRKHSEETIKKMKGHKRQVGENNSQFGTMWITNGMENKKIKKEFLNEFIKLGWYKGMIPHINSKNNLKQNNKIMG